MFFFEGVEAFEELFAAAAQFSTMPSFSMTSIEARPQTIARLFLPKVVECTTHFSRDEKCSGGFRAW